MATKKAAPKKAAKKPAKKAVLLRAVERAVNNARLSKATALYRSSQTIFGAHHFEQLPEAIVNVAMQVMAADTGSLLLPAMDGRLYVANACGLPANVQNSTRIAIGEGIAGRIAASGKPAIINGNAPFAPQRRMWSSCPVSGEVSDIWASSTGRSPAPRLRWVPNSRRRTTPRV